MAQLKRKRATPQALGRFFFDAKPVCVVSPLVEEYCREAEYAMEMAEKAATEDMRASWLRLAAKWLAMVPGRAQPTAGTFQGTRRSEYRSDSTSSH